MNNFGLRIAECGMNGSDRQREIDRIKAMLEEQNHRYASRGGSVVLHGIEGGTVKIAPAGFCWK